MLADIVRQIGRNRLPGICGQIQQHFMLLLIQFQKRRDPLYKCSLWRWPATLLNITQVPIGDTEVFRGKVLNRTDDASIEALIARMKAEGREKEIQKELKKLKNLKQTNIPKALAYVSGELFEQYIHDMKIVQHFAMLNRQAMMDEIVKGMKLHVEEQFTTIHNYIDTDAMILRKGAVSAKEGERLLIPINMRDGSLLCVGKGNEDWNCSAPHGAGRLMSRADAKQSFTVSEFKKQMAEVYTTSVSKATLDECPMAYKGMQDILDNIGPTADVVKVIRPIYNFKAGDEE